SPKTEKSKAKSRILQRLAVKKVKGLSTEEIAARNDLAFLHCLIGFKPYRLAVQLHPSNREQSEESSQFRQEYEMWKLRQDQGLDVIAQGLDTLKNTSHEMNEELYRQVPLMDEIDTKVDQAMSDLKNTNFRLKDTVNQLRSSRNFCIDIIFLCIILGIADYLYNVLKK
ncbi:syntaxin-71, partial [Olea europaea subsp. europaea]